MREGLLAKFDGPDALLAAARRARAAGYAVEAYSPHPIPGLDEALALPRSAVARFALAGGIFGALFGYGFQYYARVVAYPLDIGGRPVHPWPLFVPITFEMTILFAGLASFTVWLVASGLPRLYRPVFEVERFRAAMDDGYFLAVDTERSPFGLGVVESLLRESGASTVDSFRWTP